MMAATTARLFLALWPDAAGRNALAAWAAQWRWPATARRVPAARLHLTLHFLGELPRTRLDDLATALDVACPRFALAFGQAALLGGSVAVVEPLVPPPPLGALHRRLGEALAAAGIATEARPFRPHVTLARQAQGAGAPPAPPALAWLVRGYALVRSEGGGYRTLVRYPRRRC